MTITNMPSPSEILKTKLNELNISPTTRKIEELTHGEVKKDKANQILNGDHSVDVKYFSALARTFGIDPSLMEASHAWHNMSPSARAKFPSQQSHEGKTINVQKLTDILSHIWFNDIDFHNIKSQYIVGESFDTNINVGLLSGVTSKFGTDQQPNKKLLFIPVSSDGAVSEIRSVLSSLKLEEYKLICPIIFDSIELTESRIAEIEKLFFSDNQQRTFVATQNVNDMNSDGFKSLWVTSFEHFSEWACTHIFMSTRYLHSLNNDDEMVRSRWSPYAQLTGEFQGKNSDCVTLINDWLNNSAESNLITLMGGYGTGKTTLLKSFCANMVNNHCNELQSEKTTSISSERMIPILAPISDWISYDGSNPLFSFLKDKIFSRAEFKQSGPLQISASMPPELFFELLNGKSRFILILDGLDEATKTKKDLAKLIRCITEFTNSNQKVILATRPEIFRSAKEEKWFLEKIQSKKWY